MTTLSAKLTIHIDWACSLKDKRQVRLSLTDKVRRKFNVSIAEVGTQDMHRTLTLGIAVVSGQRRHAQEMLDEAVRFVEANVEAGTVSAVVME